MNNADSNKTNNNERKKTNYTYMDLYDSLTNLNTGFDVSSIKHFSETDFRIIMDRCHNNCIQIYGIEAFTKNGAFIDCIVKEMYNESDDKWFLNAFNNFANKVKSNVNQDIIYSASYSLKK